MYAYMPYNVEKTLVVSIRDKRNQLRRQCTVVCARLSEVETFFLKSGEFSALFFKIRKFSQK